MRGCRWTGRRSSPRCGARQVALPRHPFQRRWFLDGVRPWQRRRDRLRSACRRSPVGRRGRRPGGGDGVASDGRVSACERTLWLADDTISGRALLPGTAFVELAIRAGDQVWSPHRGRKSPSRSAALDEHGVALQVVVGAADPAGRRPVAVDRRRNRPARTRRQSALDPACQRLPRPEAADAGQPLDRVAAARRPPGFRLQPHRQLRRAGRPGLYGYGPVFQGLKAVGRCGTEEEVAPRVWSPPRAGRRLPVGLHPAVLDAALHAIDAAVGANPPTTSAPFVFAWTDVTLHAAGAAEVRSQLPPRPGTACRVTLVRRHPRTDAEAAVVLPAVSTALQLTAARGGGRRAGSSRLEVDEAGPAACSDGHRWVVLATSGIGAADPARRRRRAGCGDRGRATAEWAFVGVTSEDVRIRHRRGAGDPPAVAGRRRRGRHPGAGLRQPGSTTSPPRPVLGLVWAAEMENLQRLLMTVRLADGRLCCCWPPPRPPANRSCGWRGPAKSLNARLRPAAATPAATAATPAVAGLRLC